MIPLSVALPSLLSDARKRGCVLMLDFDGTVAAFVNDPSIAVINPRARDAVEACAKRFPVAFVSGRGLEDLKSRVGIPNLIYAGLHGNEWEGYGFQWKATLSPKVASEFEEAKAKLYTLAARFPSVIKEDKGLGIALNYRQLSTSDSEKLRESVRSLLDTQLRAGSLRLIDDLWTLDIAPQTNANKGTCALDILHRVREHTGLDPLAFYVGDSHTDEDAFRMLTDAITIRVGTHSESAARYTAKDMEKIVDLLHTLAKL